MHHKSDRFEVSVQKILSCKAKGQSAGGVRIVGFVDVAWNVANTVEILEKQEQRISIEFVLSVVF